MTDNRAQSLDLGHGLILILTKGLGLGDNGTVFIREVVTLRITGKFSGKVIKSEGRLINNNY